MDEICKTCWNDSCRNSGELYRSNKLIFCKKEIEDDYDEDDWEEGEEND